MDCQEEWPEILVWRENAEPEWNNRDGWQWAVMMKLPKFVSESLLEVAYGKVARRKKLPLFCCQKIVGGSFMQVEHERLLENLPAAASSLEKCFGPYHLVFSASKQGRKAFLRRAISKCAHFVL